VLIAAATRSNELMRSAAEISRLKGRVVVVGDVGLKLERRPFFEKEVTVVISRSTGPGRFDPAYETRGADYPLAYVRWTQQRNAASFLELVASGRVAVEPLISHHFPIAEAEAAYRIVTGEEKETAVAIVLDYPGLADPRRRVELRTPPAEPVPGVLSLGVIGAGQFARGVLLPAFEGQKVAVEGVCTASGMTAKNVGARYRASFCTSDPAEILGSEKVDALLVATRHDQHARLALEGTAAGKAVFVEKPLAILEEELAELARRAEQHGAPRLMVGFNRRFAPLAVRCRELFAGCEDPLYVFYRVNAGALPADSWVYDPVEGGGRILGEVCHFVDTIVFLTGSRPARVYAEPVHVPGSPDPHRDSVSVSLRMENGSVGVIHYLTHGDPSLAKEYFEVFGGGRAAVLDNYRSLTTHQGNKRRRHRLRNQAKGHAEEIEAFVRALREGGPMPIAFEDLLAVSQTCFLILRSLEKGQPVPYRAPGVEAE
jgi:predicted dehydrogenase